MKFNSDRARHLPSSSLIHPSIRSKTRNCLSSLKFSPLPPPLFKIVHYTRKKKKNKTKKGQEISTKIFRNLERENHPLNSPLQTPCIRSPYVEPSNRAARLNKKKKRKSLDSPAAPSLLSSPLLSLRSFLAIIFPPVPFHLLPFYSSPALSLSTGTTCFTALGRKNRPNAGCAAVQATPWYRIAPPFPPPWRRDGTRLGVVDVIIARFAIPLRTPRRNGFLR